MMDGPTIFICYTEIFIRYSFQNMSPASWGMCICLYYTMAQ